MYKEKFIWMDGKLVNWDEAKIHVLCHTLHYGNGVLEGIRAYRTKKGFAIFRLQDHIKRLFNSAKIMAIDMPFSFKEIEKGTVNLLKENKFQGANVYIRPLVYLGCGDMGLYHKKAPVNVLIAAWEWGTYLGEEGVKGGVKVKISSFARNSIKSSFSKAKVVGNYVNSQLAKYEAIQCGCEQALFLDEDGFIAEGPGECVFIVRNGKLISPPNDNSLESLTQDTIIELAKDFRITVKRRRITRDELYVADEAFFTGTAVEVTPIKEVDGRIIGNNKVGELTKKFQTAYFDIVCGKNPKYNHYLTFIDSKSAK